ncbi:MAG: hypothetical protein D6790_13600 [Caldilineae bacterium]|nr:MAG: hypothetical protein D6790_13600 [Caldilineae bacterium]
MPAGSRLPAGGRGSLRPGLAGSRRRGRPTGRQRGEGSICARVRCRCRGPAPGGLLRLRAGGGADASATARPVRAARPDSRDDARIQRPGSGCGRGRGRAAAGAAGRPPLGRGPRPAGLPGSLRRTGAGGPISGSFHVCGCGPRWRGGAPQDG